MTDFFGPDYQDYRQRTYGTDQHLRYWDAIPQDIRDGMTGDGANPMWNHRDVFRVGESLFSSPEDAALTKTERMERLKEVMRNCDVQETLAEPYYAALEAEHERTAPREARERTMLSDYTAQAQAAHPEITFSHYDVSTPEQIDQFMKEHYPHQKQAHGEGVVWGEYGVSTGKKGPDFVATDYLMDCVCVVLVDKHPDNPKATTVALAHIDATTSPAKAVATLIAEMPPGRKLEAYVLGSPKGDNPYMNTAIVDQLVQSGRVSSLAINTEGPTTVAVHAATGTLLSAYVANKSEGNGYQIKDSLPIKAPFKGDNSRDTYRKGAYNHIGNVQNFVPYADLVCAAHPNKPHQVDKCFEESLKKLTSDGQLTEKELRALTEEARKYIGNSAAHLEIKGSTVSVLGEDNRILTQSYMDPKVKLPKKPADPNLAGR